MSKLVSDAVGIPGLQAGEDVNLRIALASRPTLLGVERKPAAVSVVQSIKSSKMRCPMSRAKPAPIGMRPSTRRVLAFRGNSSAAAAAEPVPQLALRNGLSVQIRGQRGDYLCSSGMGLLPPVWTLAQRRFAVQHKKQLLSQGFRARVVRVLFSEVQVLPAAKSR